MSVESFKLVPVNMFKDLVSKTPQLPENNRSINSIIEENQKDHKKDHLYTSSSSPKFFGEGQNRALPPLWVYEDQTTLPDYSLGQKVSNAFELYKDILNNNDIPSHLKISLLQHYKDKYDKARLSGDNFDQDMMDDEDDESRLNMNDKPTRIILDGIPLLDKRRNAQEILRVFMNNRSIILWDSQGNFSLPKYIDNSKINLSSLIRILVYSNEGDDEAIEQTINIVKPFYKKIRSFINNKRVIQALDDFQYNVHNKKYLPFHTPTKKKRKRK